MWEYLSAATSHPTSALLVSAERSLAAEFRTEMLAREVLGSIGRGERTFTNIGRASGGIAPTSLSRALKLLEDKRIVVAERPLSCKPSRERLYRVADPYLRFWLTFLGPHFSEVERGRGDRVLARIRTGWLSWRGRAIEPVVREALERSAPSFARASGEGLGNSAGVPGEVGAYWTRTNDPEIDIVVADRAPVAKEILAVGSIKWLENAPFDAHDVAALQIHRSKLPGAAPGTPLIAVARSGCIVDDVTHVTPDQLLY